MYDWCQGHFKKYKKDDFMKILMTNIKDLSKWFASRYNDILEKKVGKSCCLFQSKRLQMANYASIVYNRKNNISGTMIKRFRLLI